MDLELYLWTYVPWIVGLAIGFWIVWKLRHKNEKK